MRRSIVVIGNFDGVHRGHQALLRRAGEIARQRSDSHGPLPVVAVTFWPHPMSVVAPDRQPKLLTDLPSRIELLRRYGAHEVRVVPFNREVAAWRPAVFVDTILGPLAPAVVVVGQNFRFGRGAGGDVDTLRQMGVGRFEVESLSLVRMDDDRTSSTRIRAQLADGDVTAAARELGRWFRLEGVVVVGDQRGRQLGFPTANLPVASEMATPGDGVYAGWLTQLDEPGAVALPAAISVGTNPTFDGVERRVESYVLDRTDLELYGARIAVDFASRLRGQLRFDSVEELVDQMRLDVRRTRESLASARIPA